MIQTILTVSVSTITGSVIGYCISTIKKYKKKFSDEMEKNKVQKEAFMILMQNSLTNTYYVYEQEEKIPDYMYRNWCNMKSCYEKLGGNDYIHVLDEKMKKWDFEKTDILKK